MKKIAGAILISDSDGISLSSSDFDYIIEKIRDNFNDDEAGLREEIYGPVDDEGFSFISLSGHAHDGFNAFVRAAFIAYENEIKAQPLSARRRLWDELMMALRSDPRFKE